MTTRRKRRLFGPLTYGAIALACLVLLGLVIWDSWPSWRLGWEMRTRAEELRSPDPVVQLFAARRLTEAGPAGLPWLLAATRDRDVVVRLIAFSALGRTGPVPKPAIPAFIEGLRDPDARVRRTAADDLARFGPEAIEAVEALVTATRDVDPVVRFRAARALGLIDGWSNGPALQTVLALLSDPIHTPRPVQIEAIPLIQRMGAEAEAKAVARFVPLIVADQVSTRRAIIESLEALGPPAHEAIPALERALGDQDLAVRCLAALALSEIEGWGAGRARALLVQLAKDPDLPPRLMRQVNFVVTADLVAGSEVSQPVHTLRAVVSAIRIAEQQSDLNARWPLSGAETPPAP